MLYWSIDCPSRDCNKYEAINGSVSLPLSISLGGRSPLRVKASRSSPVILSFSGCACVGCVQVSVAQNGGYLISDNSHYLETRAETVSTLT